MTLITKVHMKLRNIIQINGKSTLEKIMLKNVKFVFT